MKLYEFPTSGNCYKVRLAFAHAKKPYERQEMGRNDGSTKTPEFLKLSPLGRVPALEVAPGRVLVESPAILYYIGKGTSLWPEHTLEQAEVLRWMSFEQEIVLPTLAIARFMTKFLGEPAEKAADIAKAREGGQRALKIMDDHLKGRAYFVGDKPTIADVALFAYSHMASEGKVDLAPYPNVVAWHTRMKALPAHVPIYE
jgi:glutathione S-transferase